MFARVCFSYLNDEILYFLLYLLCSFLIMNLFFSSSSLFFVLLY